MTIKKIEDPICGKCGGNVYFAIPEIHYHSISGIEIDEEDGTVNNVDLASLEDTADNGDCYYYCDGCGEIEASDLIDQSEWKDNKK